MTYFGYLLRFLAIPIAVLAAVAWLDGRRGRAIPARLRAWPYAAAVALHVAVAVLYTTPWDNYLVATGVWYYDPARVAGVTLGWVPIEEYTFFVVQTILAGLWILFLARRLPPGAGRAALRPIWRWLPCLALAPVWLVSVAILVNRWRPGTYLGLELAWALPPIMLQLAFGGDILRRHGRLVLLAIGGMTAYLSATDFIAIGSGVWTISPAHSLNLFLGGVLPIEEVLFFLLTNTLIAFGVTLVISAEGHDRLRDLWRGLRRRLPRKRQG